MLMTEASEEAVLGFGGGAGLGDTHQRTDLGGHAGGAGRRGRNEIGPAGLAGGAGEPQHRDACRYCGE